MPTSVFDKKIFNAEVFQRYMETIPSLWRNQLIQSGAVRSRDDLAGVMTDNVSGNYITTPLLGLINGDPDNYDGTTDITASNTDTYSHSRVVVGRAHSFVEKDFAYDVTGGQDFMENIASQIASYWERNDQKTLISIIKGLFSMADEEGSRFVQSHTTDVTANEAGEVPAGRVGSTTFNDAIQKACGDNKDIFSLVIMHSTVATHLENLKLLEYMKKTDENGIERPLKLGYINGMLVLIDDAMPSTTVNIGTEGNPKYETAYTTYVLGEGAFEMTDCGAKVPMEVEREARKNGGQDYLITRQRKCFAPYGISFTKKHMAKLSPTREELENGENWEIVHTGEMPYTYLDNKAIPIAQVISLG